MASKLKSRKLWVVLGALLVDSLGLLGVIPHDNTINYTGYINGLSGIYVVVQGIIDAIKKPVTEIK